MPQLRYLAGAEHDFLNIFEFVFRQSGNPDLARDFVNRLERKCQELAESDFQLGRARPELRPDIRSYAYGNYIIFFRYIDDVLEVVYLMEGHRNFENYFGI